LKFTSEGRHLVGTQNSDLACHQAQYVIYIKCFSFPFGEIGEILAIHFYKDQMVNFLKKGQAREVGGHGAEHTVFVLH
jgi:hypothetical protein